MAVEIEKKFLIKHIPYEQITYSQKIKQGYIVKDRSKVIRIRKKNNQYFITIKGNKIGLSRFEFEYSIPKKDGEILLNDFCKDGFIKKTRHYVTFKKHTWEIDEFHEENKGLIVAEIELRSENENFKIPDWILKEVTNDSKYYNMNLLQRPFKAW